MVMEVLILRIIMVVNYQSFVVVLSLLLNYLLMILIRSLSPESLLSLSTVLFVVVYLGEVR